MSCYTRHLSDILDALGWGDSRDSRKRLDRALRAALDLEQAGCPVVWRRVKALRADTAALQSLVGQMREVGRER